MEDDMSSLKHDALNLAALLPRKRKDALQVLNYIRELIEWQDRQDAEPPPIKLVPPNPGA
jgi:hypothetical protein